MTTTTTTTAAPCEVGKLTTVNSVPLDLQFVTDTNECASIRYDFGPNWIGFEYDSYFVRIVDGEYREVYGMCGIVPLLSKLVRRVA